MGRRKRKRQTGKPAKRQETPAEPLAPQPPPPRPHKWLLATTVLLEAAWIGFLALLAVGG